MYEYRLKETNALLNLAGCPKCDTNVLMIPHVLEGISVDSNKVKISGIRGI